MIKGLIFYLFICFFVFFVHAVSSQEQPNHTDIYTNEDYKLLEELEKYLDNLKNTFTHKFLENFKGDIELLKKNIQNFEKNNYNNVTGQNVDDYDKNGDNNNHNDLEQNQLLQSNIKSFFGQSRTTNTVDVSASKVTQKSDETKADEKAEQNAEANASSSASSEEQSSSLQNTNDQSFGNTNNPKMDRKNADEQKRDAGLSNLKNIDKLCDELLIYLYKKNEVNTNNYLRKYDEFKNKFDQFLLNVNKYELLKKLILNFFKDNLKDHRAQYKFYIALMKALENEKFSQEFKKLLSDTLMIKHYESITNEQVPQEPGSTSSETNEDKQEDKQEDKREDKQEEGETASEQETIPSPATATQQKK
ncbi:hypothetical protein PFMG_03430 [Plasmodium falciparum IGH-CR14]|uniref:Merozoite surface protein C-terminal domain-containing protein n=1 Tax=Plasmodium falciparum IGH-CR14 TaxID=580059 RepID=A0A0L1ICK5_PLAFA|nr:hypothetical protein PFMG_03430 [Plasmodium falciparum IGH-CR14]